MPVVQSLVDDILLVTERELEWSVGALIEQQRIVAEGAGAAGIAAILSNPSLFSGKKIGTVICGGNIDPRLLASILNRIWPLMAVLPVCALIFLTSRAC